MAVLPQSFLNFLRSSEVADDSAVHGYTQIVEAVLEVNRKVSREYCSVEELVDCLCQPQLCPLLERQRRINETMTRLTGKSKEEVSQSPVSNSGSSTSGDVEKKKGRSMMADIDCFKAARFIYEMTCDSDKIKKLLIESLSTASTGIMKLEGTRAATCSEESFGDFIKQILIVACKSMPIIYKTPTSQLYQDDSHILRQITQRVLAEPPSLAVLPDVCAAVTTNQRCALFKDLSGRGLVDSGPGDIGGSDQIKEFTEFVRWVLDSTLPFSDLQEMICAATVLLVPSLSTGEKMTMASQLMSLKEERQIALVMRKDVAFVTDNLVEEHFSMPVSLPEEDQLTIDEDFFQATTTYVPLEGLEVEPLVGLSEYDAGTTDNGEEAGSMCVLQ